MSIRSYLNTRTKPSKRWVSLAIVVLSAATTYIDKRIYEKRFKELEADMRAMRTVYRLQLGQGAEDLFVQVRAQQEVVIDVEKIFQEAFKNWSTSKKGE